MIINTPQSGAIWNPIIGADRTGWICPKCNRGVAPSQTHCSCSSSTTVPNIQPSNPFTPIPSVPPYSPYMNSPSTDHIPVNKTTVTSRVIEDLVDE